MTAKKSMSRLQKQLDEARRQVLTAGGGKPTQGKIGASPIGVELIDNTLQIITSMQQRRKEMEGEMAALRDRCERAETANRGMEYEKAKYMEGAVWFGRRVTAEVERLCQTIDIITRELHQREQHERAIESTTSFGGSPRVKTHISQQSRNIAWFLEALKKATMNLYESSITMLESAVLNMEEA